MAPFPVFNPPIYWRNTHLQSLISSTGLRKFWINRRAQSLLQKAKTVQLSLPQGARLRGQLSQHTPSDNPPMVIIIHGWEGCCDSPYVLSLGAELFARGFDVFRLNLRDHGDTQHLNVQLYNSNRLGEIIAAVSELQRRFSVDKLFLGGFSLGGNIALRIAAQAVKYAIHLQQVFAVCPVLDPADTLVQLEQGWPIYHRYFVRKWQRSLAYKLKFFPELGYEHSLLQARSLRQMNQCFIPDFTDFNCLESYFAAYALTGDTLSALEVNSHIITSADDPIIRASCLKGLASNPHLSIELTQYGGHCGYVQRLSKPSWADQRIVQLLTGL